ncbi:unnamed protein product [Rotaria socialis]|uniref:Uncharacterized protein n=1 Tax=Rotaria socialis TaxID=392032 RepID=A0A817KTT9_9BILA|nr:unnamed protein product [Rotaria socialis]CAF4473882.1 unnamed protein product [Rotaria socialis]CAF4496449.1 unnamed protein product [Rotaria socialis]CAF4546961.1 unnamed protein product [Rotaria socialis]CAF4751118.1 unnamed protein product [Rotaria socialis]
MEGQCLRAKLPDTANVAIQIEDTQVHEQHATTQNGLTEKSIRIISKCSLNQEILGFLNQLINYFDPRSEYILVIIIEWSTKFSISIARIISANIQCSSRLLNARRCENFDDYSQQVD